jgi:hypothetical protein
VGGGGGGVRRAPGGGGAGGRALGCGLLAAGCWLLAAGCWLPWGSLSCQLALALALAQASPTANTQPASSTPGPHVKPARPLFRSLGPSKQPVFHQRQPTTIGSTDGFACVSGGVLAFQGAYTPEVLGRASSHSLHHHHHHHHHHHYHASRVVYSPVVNASRRENAPSVHQQLNSS